MSFISRIPFIGNFVSRLRRNSLIGFGNEFLANQEDFNQPFEDGYIRTSDVYSINHMIAKNGKTLPWVLNKRTGDKVEVVTSGELFDIIQNPNESQTRMQLTEQGILHYNLSGNAFLFPEMLPGFKEPQGITLLHPQLTDIKTSYKGIYNKPTQYVYHVNGKMENIPVEEVTHLKYCNPSMYGIESLRGLSPLTAGFLTMEGLTGNQVASASIFKNQGASGILSNESDYVLTEPEQKEQQALFDKKSAGASLFGKIIQSMAKVKFTRLGLDPSQLKIIESKLMKMRDMCNIYDVPSSLMNDPANKTYNNQKEAEKAFWRKSVIPAVEAFIEAYTLAIVNPFNEEDFPNGQSEYFITLDTSDVEALQEDANVKATRGRTIGDTLVKILTSSMTPNQKIQSIIESLGVDEERAKEIVSEN